MVDLNISLPESFLKGEERDGYYVSEKMKEVWAVELDLLQSLINVCKKYNIEFWADGGTMLGAVRHGGFIPWDDDIDIIMNRENYNKLCSVAGQEFKDPYFFQTDYTDPGSLRGHAQLRNSRTTGILMTEYEHCYSFNQGIFIDIFPLDFIPDDGREAYLKKIGRLIQEAYRYRRLTVRYEETDDAGNPLKKYAKKCIHTLLCRRPYNNKYFRQFEEEVSKTDKEISTYVGKLYRNPVKERTVWEWEWFNTTEEFPFEILTLPVPGGYKECLTKFYGEGWMIAKHENSFHGDVLFDTDKPYTAYLQDV